MPRRISPTTRTLNQRERDARVPRSNVRVGALPLPKLGDDIRVEQPSVHRSTLHDRALGSFEVFVGPHIRHLRQRLFERPWTFAQKGLKKDLPVLCLGGAIVLGRAALEGDDELVRQVAYDELCHCYQ